MADGGERILGQLLTIQDEAVAGQIEWPEVNSASFGGVGIYGVDAVSGADTCGGSVGDGDIHVNYEAHRETGRITLELQWDTDKADIAAALCTAWLVWKGAASKGWPDADWKH